MQAKFSYHLIKFYSRVLAKRLTSLFDSFHPEK